MQYPMIRVRAVMKEGGFDRHESDRLKLYPHPSGFPGKWLGVRELHERQGAEHVIPRAPGLAQDLRTQTSDLFLAGFEMYLKRIDGGELIMETPEIRRALADGDLERVES